MNYNDFNQVGDKSQIFDPMSLVMKNDTGKNYSTSADDNYNMEDRQQMIDLGLISNEIDDFVMDDFTQKRLPKNEDFLLDKNSIKIAREKAKEHRSIANDYSEKILSLKNSHQPQNLLILDQ